MKHEPLDAARARQHKPVPEMSDEELGEWLSTLPPCPGIPSTEEEVAEADAQGLADIAAGRCYSRSIVGEWLETRSPGTSFKDWIAARDG